MDKKNVPVLQVGGHAPAPHTPPEFRVVLLHTEGAGKDNCPDSVHSYLNVYFVDI